MWCGVGTHEDDLLALTNRVSQIELLDESDRRPRRKTARLSLSDVANIITETPDLTHI